MFYSKYIFLFLLLSAQIPNNLYGEIIVAGSLVHEKGAHPGESYKGQFLVKSTDSTDVEVKVYQADYRFNANGDNLYGEPGTLERSNAHWIKFAPQIFTLYGNTERTIFFTVSVPQKLETNNSITSFSGSYWSLIMVESKPVEKAKLNRDHSKLGITTIMRYGIQIVTNIGITENKNLLFNNSLLLKEKNILFLQFDIENDGDQALNPNVWLELYKSDGEKVGNFSVGPKRTFPKTSIRHRIKLDQVPNGDYKALLIADCGEEDLFGHQLTFSIK
jgi:hypothetical protein